MLHKLRFRRRTEKVNRNKRKWPFALSQAIATLREAITVGSTAVALTKREKEVLKVIAAAGDNGIRSNDLILKLSRAGFPDDKLHPALRKLGQRKLVVYAKTVTGNNAGNMLTGFPVTVYLSTKKGLAFLTADNRLSTTALRASDKGRINEGW